MSLPDFYFHKEILMSTLTILAILFGALALSWAIWFNVRLFQYIRSGQYEMDQRLREVCK